MSTCSTSSLIFYMEAIDFLPLPVVTTKEPISQSFIIIFFLPISYSLKSGFSLKLQVHSRHFYKKNSHKQCTIFHWGTHDKLLIYNTRRTPRTLRFYNKCSLSFTWVSFNLYSMTLTAHLLIHCGTFLIMPNRFSLLQVQVYLIQIWSQSEQGFFSDDFDDRGSKYIYIFLFRRL